jgi:hypothetical protein
VGGVCPLRDERCEDVDHCEVEETIGHGSFGPAGEWMRKERREGSLFLENRVFIYIYIYKIKGVMCGV